LGKFWHFNNWNISLFLDKKHMGRLNIISDANFQGAFLIGKEQLQELELVLAKVKDGLEKAQLIKQSLPTSLPVTGNLILDLHLNQSVKTNITISSKKNDKIISEYDSISAIWKDQKSKDFPIHKLSVNISNGGHDNSLGLEIECGYEGFIEYRLRCYDESILEDLIYELDQWIEKSKPSKVVKVWSMIGPAIGIIGGIFLLLMFTTLFDSQSYEDALNIEGRHLIDSGINQSNLPHAIDIMLKIQTKYVPKNYEGASSFDNDAYKIFLISLVIYFIIIFPPRIVIAIGKGIKKVKFYKFWIKLTMFTIPTVIVLPKIIDIIQRFIFN
jgi:hypothetical protein